MCDYTTFCKSSVTVLSFHCPLMVSVGKQTWYRLYWIVQCFRLHQHSIGYTGDGFYWSEDPTNSIKVLKENLQKKITQRTKKTQNTHTYTQNGKTNTAYNYNTTSPLVYNNMGWLGDGSHRGQGCQAWTAVGLPPRYPRPDTGTQWLRSNVNGTSCRNMLVRSLACSLSSSIPSMPDSQPSGMKDFCIRFGDAWSPTLHNYTIGKEISSKSEHWNWTFSSGRFAAVFLTKFLTWNTLPSFGTDSATLTVIRQPLRTCLFAKSL